MCKKIWNKSNILTFIGLACSIIGMYFCFLGKQYISIILLIFSGICDAFDGTFAKKMNKSLESNEYGIQLDSLVDIVSSGIFPIVICLSMGFTHIIDILIYTFFAICGITRLAYFNVNTKNENNHFCGLPITCSTILLPIVYLITKNEIAFMFCLLILSILFVSNIKIIKPSFKEKTLISSIGIIGILIILFKMWF